MLGVVGTTMAAIPTLRANRPAVVCTITSSSILASVPFYSAYRATKAAVSAFCDTARVELAPSGIRVVEILPGPVDTDMFQLSTGEPDAARFDRYRPMAEVAARLRTESADPMVSPAADAAVLIVDAILDDRGPMRYGCDPLSVGLHRPVAPVRRRDHVRAHRPVAPRPGRADRTLNRVGAQGRPRATPGRPQ